jgi:hypothetical protein
MPRGGSVLDLFSERESVSLKGAQCHEIFLRCAWNVLTRWQERLSADISC